MVQNSSAVEKLLFSKSMFLLQLKEQSAFLNTDFIKFLTKPKHVSFIWLATEIIFVVAC